jgi:hypothetical protein
VQKTQRTPTFLAVGIETVSSERPEQIRNKIPCPHRCAQKRLDEGFSCRPDRGTSRKRSILPCDGQALQYSLDFITMSAPSTRVD